MDTFTASLSAEEPQRRAFVLSAKNALVRVDRYALENFRKNSAVLCGFNERPISVGR